MKPRKHAELIKAWADGAELQTRWANNLEEGNWSDWVEFDGVWYLSEYYEYRIKPESIPDREEIMSVYCNQMYQHYPSGYFERQSMDGHYRLLGDMRLIFDGITGKLKSAEVLK